MTRTRKKPGTYLITTLIAAVVFLVIIFVVAGYFLIAPKPRSVMLEEMQDNRAIWERQAPARYSYVVDPVCDCAPTDDAPYVVFDQNGLLSARFQDLSHMTSGSGDAGPESVLSMDMAFELVERGINNAAFIQIEYHQGYGFPVDVVINWTESTTAGPEGFRIYDFRDSGN